MALSARAVVLRQLLSQRLQGLGAELPEPNGALVHRSTLGNNLS